MTGGTINVAFRPTGRANGGYVTRNDMFPGLLLKVSGAIANSMDCNRDDLFLVALAGWHDYRFFASFNICHYSLMEFVSTG